MLMGNCLAGCGAGCVFPVSRELIKFTVEGSKLPSQGEVPVIGSIDVWEAVDLFLGEPLDGAILHRPFDEIVDFHRSFTLTEGGNPPLTIGTMPC